jgi:polyisoprenoid-binding protein YceI
MDRSRTGSAKFARLFHLFQIAVLLVVIGAAFSNRTAAADPHSTSSLPAPGAYKVDPDHSFVYFSAWHHVVGVVRGRFDKVTGTITAATDPANCAVDIVIDTATISTQITERDDDLRGPDFFDVKQFPMATYQGRGVRRSGSAWIMDGTLTIRGISKTVPLTFTFKGLIPDTPAGKPPRATFHGTAAMKRGDFGMTRDNVMELGIPPAPGADVSLEIDVEADAMVPKS